MRMNLYETTVFSLVIFIIPLVIVGFLLQFMPFLFFELVLLGISKELFITANDIAAIVIVVLVVIIVLILVIIAISGSDEEDEDNKEKDAEKEEIHPV